MEYLNRIFCILPYHVKFGDKKLLEGANVYCRINRIDFRNIHTLLGLAWKDPRDGSAFFHNINTEKNNAFKFRSFIEEALEAGFLMQWDVVVIKTHDFTTGG